MDVIILMVDVHLVEHLLHIILILNYVKLMDV